MKPNRRPRRQKQDRRSLTNGALIVAALLLLAGATLRLIGAAIPPASTASVGGPFQLTEGSGRTVTDADFRGKFLLVYFGYTNCRDVCPMTLTGIASALDALGTRARDVQPLFITVDPARDTPAVVARYVGAFTPRLIGLTGTDSEIERVEREYRITSRRVPAQGAALGYAVDHTSVIYLMGKDGRFVAPIRADGPPADIARSIGLHL